MAGAYNVTAEQCATWQEVWTWTDATGAPVDLTGYTARMDVRTAPGGSLVASIIQGSGIVLGGAAGTITPTLSAAATGAMRAGTYAYDILLTSPAGFVTRLLAGSFTVLPCVTVPS